MRALLHSLHERVKRPVVPGSEHEYLATQFLAEYLAVHKNIQAVVFDSAQNVDGKNIVLFPNLLGTFDRRHAAYTKAPIKLVEGHVRVYAVKAVSYEVALADQSKATLWEPEVGEREDAPSAAA
jgi:hypothetical protein